MATGKLTYPSGAVTQSTYNFVHNYDYGHTLGYLATDDNVRALDGTLNSYAGARKKKFDLTFTRVLKAQLDMFQSLWAFQCPIDLYLDGVTLDATVIIMEPVEGTSEDAFVGEEMTYSFDVKFEEV